MTDDRTCARCGCDISHRRSIATHCSNLCYSRDFHGSQKAKRAPHGETHAGRGSTEYKIWIQMIGRCTNPTNDAYARYGGRGIRVCDRWMESVSNFIEDMGRRPSPNHSLDRIDNAGHYEPGNCRWATLTEQGRNKRNNVLLTFDGRTQPMSAWAEETGLGYSTLRRRIAVHGWSVERAITEPIHNNHGRPSEDGRVLA